MHMLNPPRERILDAAAKLFHKQGYNNTGINQIISVSKVSKASFYDHFKSKDDLCIEFLNRRYEYWSSEWLLFISGAKNLKEKILKSFDFLIYMNKKKISEDAVFSIFLLKYPMTRSLFMKQYYDIKPD